MSILQPADHPTDPVMLASSALFLMSAFIRQGGGPRLASSVLRHLELLAQAQDSPPVLAQTCAELADDWSAELRRALAEQRRCVRGGCHA